MMPTLCHCCECVHRPFCPGAGVTNMGAVPEEATPKLWNAETRANAGSMSPRCTDAYMRLDGCLVHDSM